MLQAEGAFIPIPVAPANYTYVLSALDLSVFLSVATNFPVLNLGMKSFLALAIGLFDMALAWSHDRRTQLDVPGPGTQLYQLRSSSYV